VSECATCFYYSDRALANYRGLLYQTINECRSRSRDIQFALAQPIGPRDHEKLLRATASNLRALASDLQRLTRTPPPGEHIKINPELEEKENEY